ncbi:SusD/RagB family nutrient-binding outer membrane lipoprotein [Pontibacter diazotrophicus]|uniref:SusD/RagB family nutrient-binding outer membrane lipoprotein n=1 Tax=Pontibacter diazotrophicus TaxID=1400979 RepID=A0A3D8L7U9_9BACT|nr:SusD/RagB family nutrient-binding outer membrane lipoprotein [Pontibacter diazotrophicus]RDV13479.1 SusD/RagB family nutrient-binding outer membrane lipoprotein [Pontibacter diazotrophicus]
MKIYNTLIKAVCVTAGVFVASACTEDFEQMNISPNKPNMVSSAVLLPAGIESSVDRFWGHRSRFERINLDGGMLWVQYLARNIYSDEGDNYNMSPAYYTNNWQGFYNDAQLNFQRIIVQSGPDGALPNTNYEGVGLVMRSWVFSLLTDLYGAVPYSQALQGTAETPVYTPAYDSQEAVYAGLLNDLKLANEKLVVGGPAISGDILFDGDILRWKKFANSLRLKLANRQAAKKPAESRAVMAEILGDPATYPIFESNSDYAVLEHSNVRPSNNEWHEVMVQGGRTDWNLSKTLVDKLQALNDPRLAVYGEAVDGQYVGVPNGLPDAIATTYLAGSAKLGSYFTEPTTPSVVMTYSELLFVLAEAALDGDITGDAQEYYEQAIAASFEQYGLSMPEGYLAAAGPATKENIITQKWIALFGQGVEAWTEYRRTGYPALPAPDTRAIFMNDGILPTRLQYPGSEYSLNAVQLEEGIKLNGGADDKKTAMWWAE